MSAASEALTSPRAAEAARATSLEARTAVELPALSVERLLIFGIAAITFLALAAALVFRYRVYFSDALSRAYIAASIVLSEPPSLANIGFIWSPLPSVVQMPFVLVPPFLANGFSPNIPTALSAAGSLVLLNELLRPWVPERRYRLPLLLAYQLHPMILLYAVNGMSEQLLIFFTLGCMLLMQDVLLNDWTFRSYLKATATGFLAAAAFLTRYEGFALGVVLAMMIAVAPVLLRRWRIPTEIEAALLSYSVPFVYAVFIWFFFNWTIMGNPVHFLVGPGSNREQAAALVAANPFIAGLASNLPAAAGYVSLLTTYTFPIALPVAVALTVRLILFRDAYAFVLVALLLSVPLFQVALHFQGQSFGYMRFHIYLIPISVVALAYLTHALRHRIPAAITVPFALVLVIGSAAANGNAFFREDYERFLEPRVLEVVRLTETGEDQPLAGRADLPTSSGQRTIAATLQELPRPGRILADERYADHIIVFSGQFRRFISSRDPLFRSAIRNPAGAGVDYILINELPLGASSLNDEVPHLFAQGGSGLALVGEWSGGTAGHWRLYEVFPS